jgi:hypothetical protein
MEAIVVSLGNAISYQPPNAFLKGFLAAAQNNASADLIPRVFPSL